MLIINAALDSAARSRNLGFGLLQYNPIVLMTYLECGRE